MSKQEALWLNEKKPSRGGVTFKMKMTNMHNVLM